MLSGFVRYDVLALGGTVTSLGKFVICLSSWHPPKSLSD
ncbi:hypothetical protein BH09ACT9_BH09ACT9_13660 [soil metagenome]